MVEKSPQELQGSPRHRLILAQWYGAAGTVRQDHSPSGSQRPALQGLDPWDRTRISESVMSVLHFASLARVRVHAPCRVVRLHTHTHTQPQQCAWLVWYNN